MSRPFLTANWQNLILANYECDPKVLANLLPEGTELDLWNDTCYMSLVGFQFTNTRVKGLKVPFHSNFEEVNLRFYVRYNHEGMWRRGVVFVKEIVPKAAITLVANSIYGEHYITCPMSHSIETMNNHLHVRYYWEYQKEHFGLAVRADMNKTSLPSESEAEFIAEHYWGYTKQKNTTSQYEVKHPKWKQYPVLEFEKSGPMNLLYGDEIGSFLEVEPKSVFLAEGSEIEVHPAANI